MSSVEVLSVSQEKAYTYLQRAIDVNAYHNNLGHLSEKMTRDTAEFGIKVVMVGSFKLCEDCAFANARQNNVKKLQVNSYHPIRSVGKNSKKKT